MADSMKNTIVWLQQISLNDNSCIFSAQEKWTIALLKRVSYCSWLEFSIKSKENNTTFNFPLYGKNEKTSKIIYIPHYLNNKIRDYIALTKDFKQFDETIDFMYIKKNLSSYKDHFMQSKEKLWDLLLDYETYHVFCDEFERCLDLFENINENKEYFYKKVDQIVAFLPKNQPLYAFACFVIVPSFMTKVMLLREPSAMSSFFSQMMKILDIKKYFPNIIISQDWRSEFIEEISKKYINKDWVIVPVTDVVIFTGTPENANILKKNMSEKTLFISNWAWHNPVVVSETADIEMAVKAILELQLYNQGQDCAAPNSILVHEKIYDECIEKMEQKIKKIWIGGYKDKKNIIGPITDFNELARIQSILLKNIEYINKNTPWIIHTREWLIYPTIIEKPLIYWGNFTEQFSPIFFIQKYTIESDLALYFEDEKYSKNAMYITVYGHSTYIDNLIKKEYINNIKIADKSIYLVNKHLHEKWVERGIKPYWWYWRWSSSLSILWKTFSKPTLPQRDIYERLIKPQKELLILNRIKTKIIRYKRDIKKTNKSNQFQIKFEDFKNREKLPEVINIGCWISPSGFIHIGNLREFIVARNLLNTCLKNWKKAKLNFYRDDFDWLRKIPNWFPLWLEKYIGMPLCNIPSPFEKEWTYADYFKNKFKKEIEKLCEMKNIEFISQKENYLSWKYRDIVIAAIKNRKKIWYIIGQHRTQKNSVHEFAKWYHPIVVYSRFTGRCNTEILWYSECGSYIEYYCKETNKKDMINLYNDFDMVKLKRKIDWVTHRINWCTDMEPGWSDHSNYWWSFMVASQIAKEIFWTLPPYYVGYEFVKGIWWKWKMSSSKWNLLTVTDLLKLIPSEIIVDLYSNTNIKKEIKVSVWFERLVRLFEQYWKRNLPLDGHKKNIFKKIIIVWNSYNRDKDKIYKNIEYINNSYGFTLSINCFKYLKTIEKIIETKKPQQYIKLLDTPIKKISSLLTKNIHIKKIKDFVSIIKLHKGNIKEAFLSKKTMFSKEEYMILYLALFWKPYWPNLFRYIANNIDKKKNITKLLEVI